MDDSAFGTEDRRGYWQPKELIRYPDAFVRPPQIAGILKWLPNCLFPWGVGYLHHRLFEVNHADGTIPLDRWFGSFHDGSPEADEALKRRRRGSVT